MPILGILQMRALEELLAARLLERVAALEAQLRGDGAPRGGESRRAEVRQLRQAIAEVLASQPDSDGLTAKQVGRALERAGFERPPPERSLLRHMKLVRGQTRSVTK